MLVVKELTVTSLAAFILVIIMGPFMIPMLRKFKFGQRVRDDGPQSHLKKIGTPTMGGVMFILSILVVSLLRNLLTWDLFIALLSMVGFGAIGFFDDYVKVKKDRSLGLTPMQKIGLQVLLAFIISLYSYRSIGLEKQLLIPFIHTGINIGLAYIPLMIIVILGTVNAVNLTDGLDGLAAGITSVVSIFFILFATFVVNNVVVSHLAAATLGACIGFLWFNVNPAKVFMGDTGSMALGGIVVAFAVFTKSALIIPIVGGIYFAEALSVIIQVLYFKKTKKRIFKMAPLHHHYEQCGWPETKVVYIFWIVSIILLWIGVIALF